LCVGLQIQGAGGCHEQEDDDEKGAETQDHAEGGVWAQVLKKESRQEQGQHCEGEFQAQGQEGEKDEQPKTLIF